MAWANYHSHSLFCDGKAAPEEFIKTAIARGFYAYGFTSHLHMTYPMSWHMKISRMDEYLVEISRLRSVYREKIQVYTGFEVDHIEGKWGFGSNGPGDRQPDYIIGSVHVINQYPDGSFFSIDGRPDDFFKGIRIIYRNDFHTALNDYFHRVREMLEIGKPDIVGHLDKIKMNNTVRPFFSEDDTWYRDQVEETLDLVVKRGCIMEVNTRGWYKHDPPMLYPGNWVIERAKSRNIPVMLNSDAHHPDDIDKGFSFAAGILKEAGYRSLRVMLDGKWQDRPFNETGILV